MLHLISGSHRCLKYWPCGVLTLNASIIRINLVALLSLNRIRPRSTIHSTAARSRAFSSQAPIAWKSLPATLRAERNSEKFKKNLKTYLFTL